MKRTLIKGLPALLGLAAEIPASRCDDGFEIARVDALRVWVVSPIMVVSAIVPRDGASGVRWLTKVFMVRSPRPNWLFERLQPDSLKIT